MTSAFPELGCYLLPGHTDSPRDALAQAHVAEKLGLGSVWLSERFDVKEASALAGAVCAVTTEIVVGTAATNIHTRHPIITASMATTLHYLSGGRFVLGIARGVGIRNDLLGLPTINAAYLEEFVPVLRDLLAGTAVTHDGAIGSLPYAKTGVAADVPLGFAGFGPRSVTHAASLCDGIILHTFLEPHVVKRLVEAVDVPVWSVVTVVPEPDDLTYLTKVVARLATYLQAPGYGELLVDVNGWDRAVLEEFRSCDVVSSMLGGIDSVATPTQLEQIRELIPSRWLTTAAVGSVGECANYLVREFDTGASGIIMHATEATDLSPVVASYSQLRDPARFANRTNRPF